MNSFYPQPPRSPEEEPDLDRMIASFSKFSPQALEDTPAGVIVKAIPIVQQFARSQFAYQRIQALEATRKRRRSPSAKTFWFVFSFACGVATVQASSVISATNRGPFAQVAAGAVGGLVTLAGDIAGNNMVARRRRRSESQAVLASLQQE